RVDGCGLVGGRLRLFCRRLVVCARGGLIGDGDGRRGVVRRLVGDGGCSLRLRGGPALLLFGQGGSHSWWWICARESRTARASLKPCPKRSGCGPWGSTPRSAPSCVEIRLVCRSSAVLPLGAGRV